MHIIEIELCICALIKPFGQFISGLPFYFWRDVGDNNGQGAEDCGQGVGESDNGRYVWYGIRRHLEQFRMRLGLAQYLVLPRLPASTRGCGCGARPGISKSRWSFCLAVFCSSTREFNCSDRR